VDIYRLPKKNDYEFDFCFSLDDLRKGDNPVYIKVMQQDGHIAWSSPVYLIKK
jgi:hypothetical protein